MKDTLKMIFGTIGVILFIALIAYIAWIVFIPMQIGSRTVERKVTEQSLQYVISQKSALMNLNVGYSNATTPEQKTAIKNQMCQIAATIPSSEIPGAVMPIIGGCL